MIMELVSLLGSSVGGKVFGMVSDVMAERRHAKTLETELTHKQQMALIKSHTEYQDEIHEQNKDGGYSPLSHVVAYSVGLFAVTYCIAALSCFIDTPTEIVYTKDPAEDARIFSVFWGFIEWDIANNQVLKMSKIGLGYLMLHPIVFILSMVTTGDKPRKR